MKTYYQLLLLTFSLLPSLFLIAQPSPEIAIIAAYDFIYTSVDNDVKIIAQQENSIKAEQLEVSYCSDPNFKQAKNIPFRGNDGLFIINLEHPGFIEFRVKIGDQISKQVMRVKLLEAESYLSGYRSGNNNKISVNEMHAQGGLSAIITCCGFEAGCTILSYDILRISSDDSVNRVTNLNSQFNEPAELLINAAISGDIYLFRNIYYQCGEAPKQRARDIIVEVE